MNYDKKHKYFKYKQKYLQLKYKQTGGNEEILRRMRDFCKDFVLVIGSSEHEQWYREFTALPENHDKMIISLDLHGTGTNNFKLNFNEESTWKILSEFNERFSTIIFDYLVDKFIVINLAFDILEYLRNLLKNRGKLYKYFSYGNFFVPNNIRTQFIDRTFIDRDFEIIIEQFNGNISFDNIIKIKKISSYGINETDYGFYYSNINNIINIITIDGVDKSENNFFINYPPSESIFMHIKSLYLFYNQNFYSEFLQKKYNFSTEVFETCETYPLNNPNLSRPAQKICKYDYCYIVCTK